MSAAPEPVSLPDGPGSDKTATSRKRRSPLERTIVWGGIALLLALVAVQAQARFGYERTRGRLLAVMEADAASGKNQFLTVDQVAQHVAGWPKRDDTRPGEVTYT